MCYGNKRQRGTQVTLQSALAFQILQAGLLLRPLKSKKQLFLMDVLWICNGYIVDTKWILYGYKRDVSWISYGYEMDIFRINYGYKMDMLPPPEPK